MDLLVNLDDVVIMQIVAACSYKYLCKQGKNFRYFQFLIIRYGIVKQACTFTFLHFKPSWELSVGDYDECYGNFMFSDTNICRLGSCGRGDY